MEKSICNKCIKEDFLAEYIIRNGKKGNCTYCSNSNSVMNLDTIVEIILDGIRSEYDIPENGLGWMDGEWVEGAHHVQDSYSLLSDELGLDESEALQDISDELFEFQWYPKDFYGYSDSEELIYTWKYFKDQVMHRSRYVFIKDKVETEPSIRYSTPSEILHLLCNFFEQNGFIDKVKSGTSIYRGRFSKTGTKFFTIEELGPPDKKKAIYQNRFSPAGIPMFYGSEEKETCFAEVGRDSGVFSIAKWKVKRDIYVIDVTKALHFAKQYKSHYYPNYPSIFDETRRHLRAVFSFLIDFANDISKPIKLDGREHIEYVPTQIVVEFIRRIYEFEVGQIDGFCFYSSMNGEKNYVIFADINNCKKDSYSGEQLLELVEESVDHKIIKT